MHDIIFRNAEVIDGTGKPALRADVAVAEGRIADVGELKQASGKHEINARGSVVTPGFIDMHSHADFSLPVQPTADSMLHQGITTAVAQLVDEGWLDRNAALDLVEPIMRGNARALFDLDRKTSALKTPPWLNS